jgi:hypothetical protein
MELITSITYLAGPAAEKLHNGTKVVIPFPGILPAEFDSLFEAEQFLGAANRNPVVHPYAIWERTHASGMITVIRAEPTTRLMQEASYGISRQRRCH